MVRKSRRQTETRIRRKSPRPPQKLRTAAALPTMPTAITAPTFNARCRTRMKSAVVTPSNEEVSHGRCPTAERVSRLRSGIHQQPAGLGDGDDPEPQDGQRQEHQGHENPVPAGHGDCGGGNQPEGERVQDARDGEVPRAARGAVPAEEEGNGARHRVHGEVAEDEKGQDRVPDPGIQPGGPPLRQPSRAMTTIAPNAPPRSSGMAPDVGGKKGGHDQVRLAADQRLRPAPPAVRLVHQAGDAPRIPEETRASRVASSSRMPCSSRSQTFSWKWVYSSLMTRRSVRGSR